MPWRLLPVGIIHEGVLGRPIVVGRYTKSQADLEVRMIDLEENWIEKLILKF